jgi:predicted nuclease of restriction endonuclease-like (RecB) superfamily
MKNPSRKTTPAQAQAMVAAPSLPPAHERSFREVLEMIEAARARAYQAVNTELIDLYWRVGEYISRKIETAAWGQGVVIELATYLQRHHPNLRGFTRASLFRMRQFFDTYRNDKKVAALLRQLKWTHHLMILGRCKAADERQFYIRMSVREGWTSRDLDRQLKASLFARAVLSPPKVAATLRQSHPEAAEIFKDSYIVEFLQLPADHSESDLQRGLVARLKDFLIELGRDFCFVGSEYPVQVGGRDFAIDLLFFNRALNSLVAFELKVDEF